MKESVKEGLVYTAGLIIMGFSLIPANLPFTLALRRLFKEGYTGEISLFLQDNNLDHLPFSLEEKFFFTFFPFMLLLGMLILVWKVFHRKKLLRLLTGAPRFRTRNFFKGFILWTLFALGSDFIIFLGKPETYHFSFQLLPWLKLVLVGLLFIIPQITLEEVFFRSYLIQGGTLLTRNPLIPLVLVSLVFGLLHGANPEVKSQGLLLMMPQYMGMGLFLAYLAWKSNGLEISLAIHLANNCWGIIMVNGGGTSFKTPSPVMIQDWDGLSSLITLGVSISLFLLIHGKTKLFTPQEGAPFYGDH